MNISARVGLAAAIVALTFTSIHPAVADPDAHDSVEVKRLTDAIAELDKRTFDAFNAHDVNLLMSMFTEDVEFYHDKGGLTNYRQTRNAFVQMFANMPDIKRTLVPGTL